MMPAKVTKIKKTTKKKQQQNKTDGTSLRSLQQADLAREKRRGYTPQQNQRIPRPSSIDVFMKCSMLSLCLEVTEVL